MDKPSTVLASAPPEMLAPAHGEDYTPSGSALGLVVATDAALSLRYMDVLRQGGFHCLTVQNDSQVIGVLTRYHPDLVVIDISAFGDDANNIVKYIRLRCAAAHFVGVTRNPRSWDTNTSVILGLDGLHSTWPDKDRLLRLCSKILDERRRGS